MRRHDPSAVRSSSQAAPPSNAALADAMHTAAAHNEPGPAAKLAGTRVLLFALLLLLLNLQADGLPLGGNPLAFQLHLLPVTLLFLALLAALLFPQPFARQLPPRLITALSGWRAPLALVLALFTLSLPVLLAETRHYAYFGYHLSVPLAVVLFALSLALLAAPLLRRTLSGTHLAIAIAAVYTAVTLLSIRSFPLALGRSDMLPLLAAANRTLLAHGNPYRLYTFPSESVFLTYLPGTLLSYLPATLLRLDLRVTNLVCALALVALIVRAARPDRRLHVAALLGLFLLGPYLLYRHELYTPPHWLALATSLLLAQRGRPRLAAVVFGLSIAMSQFSWILLPFLLLLLLEQHGRHAAALALSLSLATAAALTLPFVLAGPHSFLASTFGHWGQIGLTARPVNLSFFTAAVIGTAHLPLAQFTVLALLFLAAVRTHACRTFAGALRLMALALAAFILLNLLVWGYFFLLLELLLLLYLLAGNDLLQPPMLSSSASHSRA